MHPALRTGWRRALLWLLVALVPLHAGAAGVIGALGPLHVHAVAGALYAAVQPLEDVRRASPRSTSADRHEARFGHSHATTPARHRHAASDPAVVPVDDPAAASLADADEMKASPGLAALAAMPAGDFGWTAPRLVAVRAASDAWPSLTHDPAPFERPPRGG